ncbi:hypothetical protein SDC9_31395 [bioreactor metagenome]|jgi:Predicted hydrolase (HAD superfamily)|uniref:Uncharacterized protein n=1 Tax=bioreactor metagenome TaxID=1076179 RepID=A0A644V2I8_9ZZZZ|nr:hypothetical protein [Acidaminococcaceae bacterium]
MLNNHIQEESIECLKNDIILYSFDVFDTVIGRLATSSFGVFAMMQRLMRNNAAFCGFPDEFIENFYVLRIEAEKLAYKRRDKKKTQEIMLADIYSYLAYDFALSDEAKQQLMTLEENVEYGLSCGVFPIIKQINSLQNAGKRIVFISDMYLDECFIRKLLIKAEPSFIDIPLYVSSTYGKTKATGDLFAIVKDKENIPNHQWLHIGDNPYSDVAVPQKLGLRTKRVALLENKSLDRLFDKQLGFNIGAQLYNGASKLARIENDDFRFRTGCDFGGPILMAYVEWLVEQCSVRHISRLYFIARDGYVLQKICQAIIEKRGLNIMAQYIYSSREAWGVTDSHKKALIAKYLQQELDVSDQSFAFVDVFGSGKTQDCMAKILKTITPYRVRSFYYYLDNYDTVVSDKFCFCRNADIWNNIELLCKSTEGQCTGFAERNGRIVPICREEEGEKIKKFHFSTYVDGIMSFTKYYLCADAAMHNVAHDNLPTVEWYIRIMNEFPNKSLLRYFTEFPCFPCKAHKYSSLALWERKMERNVKKVKYIIKVLEKSKLLNLLKKD